MAEPAEVPRPAPAVALAEFRAWLAAARLPGGELHEPDHLAPEPS